MTNILYSVDVRELSKRLTDKNQEPSRDIFQDQDLIHDYVLRELNFLKGQMTEDEADEYHIMVVPVLSETSLDLLF